MPKPRKTIPVDFLKSKVNRMLSVTTDEKVSEREALAVLLETVLEETSNYRGFTYNSQGVDVDGKIIDPSRRLYF